MGMKVQKQKYGNGSMVTEVQKKEEKLLRVLHMYGALLMHNYALKPCSYSQKVVM